MKLRFTLLALTLCTAPIAGFGHDEKAMPAMDHAMPASPSTIQAKVSATDGAPIAGKKLQAIIRLRDAKGDPVTLDQLQTAHTEKIHLLIIDESLTDYHHEHPVPTGQPGEFAFTFRPSNGGSYRIFADLLPTATGKQEYAQTQIEVQGEKKPLDESVGTTATVDGYRFELQVEGGNTLRAGEARLLKVRVTQPDGQPASVLEPVMGAFAHGVAFPADRSSVVHVHPMGPEPEKASERGGPDLSFHVMPEQAGYLKFFVQVQIDGRDRFAGFGLKVDPSESAATPHSAGASLTPRKKQFLERYESIRAALAADDLAAAQKAATTLPAAVAIAQSDSIRAARNAFKTLSMEAVKLARGQPGYFEMNCPMVKNGDWVQTNTKIANPYMGAAMLECGTLKK